MFESELVEVRGRVHTKGSEYIGDRDKDRSSWGGVDSRFRVVELRISVSWVEVHK